ncbi:hypothetical protein INR49_011155 [Caranx melampygus]|nr:hypothetical protein INR49_011155 [Caranx melampygus]
MLCWSLEIRRNIVSPKLQIGNKAEVVQGANAAIKKKKKKKLQLGTIVLTTGLIRNFTVVVLVGGAAEHPPSGPELQDLQQQQTGHGAEALLEQEAVPQQEEQLVHPLTVHLLQLLSDTVVKDVTDECDVAHPLLKRAPPGLLTAVELLLESIQQVSPEHVPIALLGLGLSAIIIKREMVDKARVGSDNRSAEPRHKC